MKAAALIGYTGFVGGNLDKRMTFTHRYRRRNIADIKGNEFALVVCAGMPAEKWRANQNPNEDAENTDRLIEAISRVEAEEFVLISTIDIYQNDRICTELDQAQPMHTYGKNRLKVEEFVKDRFLNSIIIRLPALFGPGLKKNAIYDLMHNNQVEKINPKSEFQWYDLDWLADDITRCRANGVKEVNLFTEPVSMGRICNEIFPGTQLNPNAPFACYAHQTALPLFHGGHDGESGYVANAREVIDSMIKYVRGNHGVA